MCARARDGTRDLRLQRWLDVIMPIPWAFENQIHLGYNSVGRLCGASVSSCKQAAERSARRHLSCFDNRELGTLELVTWRGLIGCVFGAER